MSFADSVLSERPIISERPIVLPGVEIYRSPNTVDIGAAISLAKVIYILGSVLRITCDFFATIDGTHFLAPYSPVHYNAQKFKYSFVVYYPQGYLRATARIYRLPSDDVTSQDKYVVEFMRENNGDRIFMSRIFTIFQDVIAMNTHLPVSEVLLNLKLNFKPQMLVWSQPSFNLITISASFCPSDADVEQSIKSMVHMASSIYDDVAINACSSIASLATNSTTTSANFAMSHRLIDVLFAKLFGRYSVATKSMAVCALNVLFTNTRVLYSEVIVVNRVDQVLTLIPTPETDTVNVLELLTQMSTIDSLFELLGDARILHYEIYYLVYYCRLLLEKITLLRVHKECLTHVLHELCTL